MTPPITINRLPTNQFNKQVLSIENEKKSILSPSINSWGLINQPLHKFALALLLFLFWSSSGSAQDLSSGVTAIEEAATGITPYFGAIETLIYVIAGIIALLGGVRVYMKWNMGDPEVMSSAAGWFGSAVFLLVAVTFIKGFFGI